MGDTALGWAQAGLDGLRGTGDYITRGLTKKIREGIWGESGQILNQTAYGVGQVGGAVIEQSLIAAGTGGLGTLAANGSTLAGVAAKGIAVYDAGSAGYQIGTGIDRVSQGDMGGFLDVALGAYGVNGAVNASKQLSKCMQENAFQFSGTCFVAGTLVLTASGYVAIEDLKIGDRVVTALDEEVQGSGSKVDAATWKVATLHLPDPFGGVGAVEVQMLRSPEEMAARGIVVGESVWLGLDEMGLFGWAQVKSIKGCPSIQIGEGRVILSTFKSYSNSTLTIALENGETLEPTSRHPIFSADSRTYVPAGKLALGEKLRTRSHSSALVSRFENSAARQIFNIEVEGEHRYFVGKSSVLVHNSSTLAANKAAGKAFEQQLASVELPQTQSVIREQITLKSLGPSGKITRIDLVGTETSTGLIKLTEAKASLTAPLTKNQKVVHPELQVYGGVVVGEGKAPYVGGTKIPPTKVDVKRP